jgi:hypothetical protein
VLICSAISLTLLPPTPFESPCPLIITLRSPFGISSNLSPLKVHVKAADFGKAKELLYQFKGTLPPSASMAHINIKTQKNDDWFDQHDALKLVQV